MQQHRSGRWMFAVLAAAALALLLPLDASAQFRSQPRHAYSISSYERLQQLSQQLEAAAARARDSAKLDERQGGRDEVTNEIEDFAKEAHHFRLLMHERDVPASKINEQIRDLVDDGRKVQRESAKAKFRSPEAQAEWNAALALLNEINNEFMVANGLASPAAVGTTGNSTAFPRRTWVDSRRTLVADLYRRADNAVQLSENSYVAAAPEIVAFREEVIAFQRDADRFDRVDAHANILRMLDTARALQQRLVRESAPPQLRDDIAGIVGTLVQMRDMTAERVEGTTGYVEPGIATDRYAMMDAPQLQSELVRRTLRASEMAERSAFDADVARRIAHFRDELREFNNRATTLGRDDRHDRIDSLLEDAQRTQRELAKSSAPADLVEQWNAVVELLVKLRDVS